MVDFCFVKDSFLFIWDVDECLCLWDLVAV